MDESAWQKGMACIVYWMCTCIYTYMYMDAYRCMTVAALEDGFGRLKEDVLNFREKERYVLGVSMLGLV